MPITRSRRSRRKTSSRKPDYDDWYDSKPPRRSSRSSRTLRPVSRSRAAASRPDAYYEPAPRRKKPRQKKTSPARFSMLGNVSPERRMDILGVVMAIVGLLTILSLFSVTRSQLSSSWVKLLSQVFGWGVYLLPLGLVILGAWLVARNVDRLPALTLERIIGILLLFTGLLAAFHALNGPVENALARAYEGKGGGYLG